MGVVAAYLFACLGLRALTGLEALNPINSATVEVAWRYLFVATALPLGFHLAHFLWLQIRIRRASAPVERSSLLTYWTQYRTRYFSIYRFSGLAIACLSLAALLSTFWAFKKVLPIFSPFVWDPALMSLDKAAHLGTHPWALLQPVLGHPAVTFALDRLYYVWFVAIPIMIAWQGWSLDRRQRSQFLITYALCWVLLGTVAAYWFSSAGPCYYGAVAVQPDPFAPLMSYLYGVDESVPLNALQIQEWLWAGYIGTGPLEGISAMPSLHVALPVLYALVAFRVSRWLGTALVLYAVLILLGSVHLG